jgi:putative inorganic carbon (hco3(-)) transporter
LGLGLTHYIPVVLYIGFWVMSFVSLAKEPLWGFYYMCPFVPYRTLRDHFQGYPLGENMITILLLSVIVGALVRGKHLPKSKLYFIWLVFGIFTYLSMWMGTAMGTEPAPLWITDVSFVTWKDYMVIPLIFIASGLVLEDRKSIRNAVAIIAITLLAIDRSYLLESMSHTWANFDENKRGDGPLSYGPNQTAAFLAQFAMFFWGFGQFLKKKYKLFCYALVGLTIVDVGFAFSRAGYLALLVGLLVLALVKDRKLLLVLGAFLLTWQAIVPKAVVQRVDMTKTADGQLEASAQERVDLWTDAEQAMISRPIFGSGFASYQLGEHVGDLRDTHNWYVKVMVETGIVGMIIVLVMLYEMLAIGFRLYRRATDPLYRGLGLGLLVCVCCCLVANLFGDRWTYVEITGLVWVLVAASTRALELPASDVVVPLTPAKINNEVVKNPYLAYR